MFKRLILTACAIMLSVTATAGVLTQTQVTGNSNSHGNYQSEMNGVTTIRQISYGSDAQTYSNNCGSSCNTDNTATFSFSEKVNTLVVSHEAARGVEKSTSSFYQTSISTDNLTAGNSNSTTTNRQRGHESKASDTYVSGKRVEIETTSNGGAEYGEVITVTSWSDSGSDSYRGHSRSSSVVNSQSSFLY